MKRQWCTRLGLGYLVGRVELWRMELQSIPWLCFWGFWEDHRNSLSNCHLLRGLESRLWCCVNQQRTFRSSMQLNTLQYTVLTFFKCFVWCVISQFAPVGSDINSFLVHHLEQLMLKDLNSWLAKPNVLISCWHMRLAGWTMVMIKLPVDMASWESFKYYDSMNLFEKFLCPTSRWFWLIEAKWTAFVVYSLLTISGAFLLCFEAVWLLQLQFETCSNMK